MQLPTRQEIELVAAEIDSVIPPTPQYSWPLLNARAGCELWVKHENHTAIGSFKIRGAVCYIRRLTERAPRSPGVIAATRGNFGQAVAFAAAHHRLRSTIVVPHGNSPDKNRAIRALGAELIEEGDDFQAALIKADALAGKLGLHSMPSFHRDLVLGNSVSMLRFLRSVPALEAAYVPIGLGSGICALMAARDALGLPTRIVGVASALAPAIALSFEADRLVTHPATTRIADGMACSTPDPDALEQILRGVDRVVTVSDAEVEAAMRACFLDTHNVIEGAGAAGMAALLREREAVAGRRVGVVFSGGNVDAETFARILSA
ncbi:MAG TPA: threonine dehydratase [Opitutaceae bacterium]